MISFHPLLLLLIIMNVCLCALSPAIPVILKSSKAAMEKECTEGSEESSFKGLCSYIALALVEALNKVIVWYKI